MKKRGVSSDGVPNRKGGSWPNHPAMRYELPIPFSPGAENVTDAYRDGWDRIFGPKPDYSHGASNPGCGTDCPEDHTLKGLYATTLDTFRPPECEACGELGFHRLDRGLYACEIES